MAELELRPAQLTDHAGIAHMHRLSRADYYGVPVGPDDRDAMWRHLLGEAERVTWVAEARTELVGFLSARHPSGPSGDVKLTALYVLPAQFGRGIGSSLHDLFAAQLAPGRTGILEVWAGNARAIGFYERRGWRPTTETRDGPQGIDFVTYRLPPRAEGG